MPKKICNFPSCNTLINMDQTHCKDHGTSDIVYSKYNRDPMSAKFYNSSPWRKKRKEIMQIYGGLCQVCLSNEVTKPADVVDHIIELKDDDRLALDNDNLVPLCHACHNSKKISI